MATNLIDHCLHWFNCPSWNSDFLWCTTSKMFTFIFTFHCQASLQPSRWWSICLWQRQRCHHSCHWGDFCGSNWPGIIWVFVDNWGKWLDSWELSPRILLPLEMWGLLSQWLNMTILDYCIELFSRKILWKHERIHYWWINVKWRTKLRKSEPRQQTNVFLHIV